MSRPFAAIDDAIEAIRRGRMVVVVDDEDRENEGDLTLAAQHVSPASIAFMATHGRGLVCVALEGDLLDRLHIPMMVQENSSPFQTGFCVSVEAREGTTTGISAPDRARTIRALIDPGARPTDFLRPGHTFPLRARPGGVLTRTGQTEASVDLARLAGLHPSGVICEIMKDDGTMARVPDLVPFCERHGLLLATVADLVSYRLRREPLVRRVAQDTVGTTWGELLRVEYQGLLDGERHWAFVLGEPAGAPPLVRVHRESIPEDLDGFGGTGRTPFATAMGALAREGRGILVYLRGGGPTPSDAFSEPEIGVGAQILRDLGVHEMRLLSRHEKKYIGLKGFGLDIAGYVPLERP